MLDDSPWTPTATPTVRPHLPVLAECLTDQRLGASAARAAEAGPGGRRYADWPVADPDGGLAETVRAIRDEIDARVRTLLDELPTA
ncbi:hypothetical protein [Streptodolium elevatio]